MASVLAVDPSAGIVLSARQTQQLIDRGDGDAALLYLAILRRHGDVPPRSLAGELRWDKGRIERAEQVLRDLGLLAAPAAPDLPADDEPAAYPQRDIAEALEGDGDFRTLVAQVEQRLGKKLALPNLEVLLDLYDQRGLSAQVIFLLVCHCQERSRAQGQRLTFPFIRSNGYAWVRKGITSPQAVDQFLKDYRQQQSLLPAYMRALSLGDRPPVGQEEKYLTAWLEWGFPPETVRLAYEKTVFQCGTFKWAYCNAILRRWHESGLLTPDAVEAQNKKPPAAPQGDGSNAWMRQFIQGGKEE